eukprot:scaffold128190_cov48-Phaeocystis_antarctica.AAC.2
MSERAAGSSSSVPRWMPTCRKQGARPKLDAAAPATLSGAVCMHMHHMVKPARGHSGRTL